jgi:hypothetical protein
MPNPQVKTKRCGTMLIVDTWCNNCEEHFTWKSQSYLFGKFPAGNILLSFAIFSAGGSVSKVRREFNQLQTPIYIQCQG